MLDTVLTFSQPLTKKRFEKKKTPTGWNIVDLRTLEEYPANSDYHLRRFLQKVFHLSRSQAKRALSCIQS